MVILIRPMFLMLTSLALQVGPFVLVENQQVGYALKISSVVLEYIATGQSIFNLFDQTSLKYTFALSHDKEPLSGKNKRESSVNERLFNWPASDQQEYKGTPGGVSKRSSIIQIKPLPNQIQTCDHGLKAKPRE